jgi:hypothetical protein
LFEQINGFYLFNSCPARLAREIEENPAKNASLDAPPKKEILKNCS